MGKFKIGDRVRCIDDGDTSCVKRGEEYDVMGVHEPYIDVLVDGELHGMYAHRFALTPAITIEPGKHYRTRSGKPTGRVTVGDTGFEAVVGGRVRIYDAAGGHVHGDADLDIVEAWVPRVGERVVLVKDGKSTTGAVGKAATVITWSDGSFIAGDEYLLDIDPPVNYKTVAVTPKFTRATIDCFEPLPVAAEAQPAAPLKIEAGKFYRTRDGRKVGPMKTHSGSGLIEIHGDGRVWELDGGHRKGCRDTMNYSDDLIAEWQDTPSAPVAAQVDAIAEEYGPALQQEPDTTLHLKFTSDFSELDAAILVRKKKLKKLIKLARKAGIELREAA